MRFELRSLGSESNALPVDYPCQWPQVFTIYTHAHTHAHTHTNTHTHAAKLVVEMLHMSGPFTPNHRVMYIVTRITKVR